MFGKILSIIAISVALLLSQGESYFFAARYCLRPLARLEKGIPSFTNVNEGILNLYGIAPGKTAMLPTPHLDTRVADKIDTTARLTMLQQEALGTLNGNGQNPRHIEIPIDRLPIELGEILAEIRLLSLLSPDQKISAYGFLEQYCDSVTLVPYIIKADQAGNITQPGCVAIGRKLYLSVGELRTRTNGPVKHKNEVTAESSVEGTFIKINGIYSLIETAARMEAARLADEKRLPAGKEWREKATATILLTSLYSMGKILEVRRFDRHENIDGFINLRRAVLISKLRGLNKALALPGDDFSFGHFATIKTPMPISLRAAHDIAKSLPTAI